MKGDNQINKKPGGKIDANAFIRQVASTDIQEEMPESMPESMPGDSLPEVTGSHNEPDTSVEEKVKEPPKRKKGQPIDYESVFLSRNELRNRQGLYIGKETYEILQTLVRSIRNERLSVSGLVDNIISHHIELYEDDINRIYEENIKRPIKRNSK